MTSPARNPLLEPVDAYDCLASSFGKISDLRRPFLAKVEDLICAEMPAEAESLLDVGAGAGSRAARIASQCSLARVLLLEPSLLMQRQCASGAHYLGMRAEELDQVQEQFDVVICLWNVLGHVTTAARRQFVMVQMARILKPKGRIFLDVSHRYNAAHYGFVKTVWRYVRDVIRPGETNGDVVAKWQIGANSCATYGHVFTDREMRTLAASAGLSVRKRFVVDYATGELRGHSFLGHLLYCLERLN